MDLWITNYYPMDRLAEASKGNIRVLRERVRRVVLEGKFPQKGELPVKDHWGAMTYTKEKIEWYDWRRALELCRLDKEAGSLMGKNAKNTSKILTRLCLSKKQRKKQEPQA